MTTQTNLQPGPIALIPESAPFSPEQRAWLNGFLAGIFSRAPGGTAPSEAAAAAAPLASVTILFGSQTGTAESLAKRAAKEAGRKGFAATVRDMAGFGVDSLSQERNLLVITSTFGDGDPPDNAKALHGALSAATVPALAGVRYSVCGLGDTKYAQFCRCAQDFDQRLEALGATRVAPCANCDLDYEEIFVGWLEAALKGLEGSGVGDPGLAGVADSVAAGVADPGSISRKNPCFAPVLNVRCLNGPGSAKEVNHVEISLEGLPLTYEAGDALGVFPQNCPALVDDILAALGCDGEEAVPAPDGSAVPLRRALTEFYDLGKPTPELLGKRAAVPSGQRPPDAGTNPSSPALPGHQVIDVLLAFPDWKLMAAEFVGCLRKLQPRLYSISSSPKAHPGQVHLTVAAVRYELSGRHRKGACSTFLAERAASAGKLAVFVHSNRAFRPPARGETPIIMIGPGTGIAPFRAFLAERMASKSTGKNWLFFGDQRADSDFLYREELEEWLRTGCLTRLDTAFSRDQPEKIYVQHRMLEQAGELYAWLEAGAHLYVCGDASRMAKDVDAALHQIVEKAGGRRPEEAAQYIEALRTSKRYARDVY